MFHITDSIQIVGGAFYWNNNVRLLSNIDITLYLGRITGLWGHSGSGKSTFVQLLQRKYDLCHGHIAIDGANISTFDLHSYRKNIGVVPQQIKIFNASLLENILLGRPVASMIEAEDHIRMLGVSFFLDLLGTDGLYTPLGEDGRQPSGGKLQMLAVIRALYEHPKIVIIGEGLNGIDMEIENHISGIIKEYSVHNAILIITHNVTV